MYTFFTYSLVSYSRTYYAGLLCFIMGTVVTIGSLCIPCRIVEFYPHRLLLDTNQFNAEFLNLIPALL